MTKIKSKLNTARSLMEHYRVKNGYYNKKGNKKIVIVMYHGIDLVQCTKYNQRFFSKNNFEAQIALFKKHFNILTHAQFMSGDLSSDRLNIVITFDDGYRNNYAYALPVLDKYNAHAYFFVTGVATERNPVLWADAVDIVSKHAPEKSKIALPGADFVLKNGGFVSEDTNSSIKTFIKASSRQDYGEKAELVAQLLSLYDFEKEREHSDYWQLMNDDEIAKAAQSKNITIGSHGFYHHNLGSLSHNDAIGEVIKSKEYLEALIQKTVTTIGFPDGSYTPMLNESLYLHGFEKQFLVNYCFSDAGNKEYVYDRLGLYPYMGEVNQLLHKIIN